MILFVIYNFFDVMKGCDADGVLPNGVIEVEIDNWTKTREPVEVVQGEKKINSHEDLWELNNGVADVDKLEGLYDGSFKLVDIDTLNENRIANGNSDLATGGKVLRTIMKSQSRKLSYDFSTISEYLRSDNPVNWQNDRISWSTYTSQSDNAMEWRMVSGRFNLNEQQMNLLDSNKYQIVLGVPVDNQYGFELIIPFNDVLSVFINGGTTRLNYKNSNLVGDYILNNNIMSFEKVSRGTEYANLCSHTGNSYVDLKQLNTNSSILKSNLSKNVSLGENRIDFLIGNLTSSSYGGFSRLNLYIIEIPKIDVRLDFYKYDGEDIVYFDNEYTPDMNEEVYFDVVLENFSENIILENISIEGKIGDLYRLRFNSSEISYNDQPVEIENCTYTLHPLSEIILRSGEFKYTVTKENCVREAVYSSLKLRGSYIIEGLPYLEVYEKLTNKDNRLKNPVEKNIASLSVNCEVEGGIDGQEIVFQLSSSDDFCNIILKNGHTSNVKNLGLKLYNVNLIVPQGYELVECPTSFSFDNRNLSKSTTVKLRKKDMNCFYKDDRVMIGFE